MNVSPNELRKETVGVLNQVNAQIQEIEKNAEARGVSPHHMVDSYGAYQLSPLLMAKSQCLNTLTLLNEQGKRR
jgi:hypothetical protein